MPDRNNQERAAGDEAPKPRNNRSRRSRTKAADKEPQSTKAQPENKAELEVRQGRRARSRRERAPVQQQQ